MIDIKYGCYCDLSPGEEPDGCVIDISTRDDCVHASKGINRDDCEYWRPIEEYTSIDELETEIQQLQANQAVLLEALERIEAMAECPACFCGYPTGTAEIKECAQQTLKAVKDES